MEGVCANLSAEGVVLRNLKSAMYRYTVKPLESRVISMSSHGNFVFVGIANQGCHMYRLENYSQFYRVNIIDVLQTKWEQNRVSQQDIVTSYHRK